jgi:hypothetical protein
MRLEQIMPVNVTQYPGAASAIDVVAKHQQAVAAFFLCLHWRCPLPHAQLLTGALGLASPWGRLLLLARLHMMDPSPRCWPLLLLWLLLLSWRRRGWLLLPGPLAV